MEMALQPGCMNVHVYVCTVCTICTADARRSGALPFALPVETVVRRPRDALLRYPDVACVALPVALSFETDVRRPLPVVIFPSYTVAH